MKRRLDDHVVRPTVPGRPQETARRWQVIGCSGGNAEDMRKDEGTVHLNIKCIRTRGAAYAVPCVDDGKQKIQVYAGVSWKIVDS